MENIKHAKHETVTMRFYGLADAMNIRPASAKNPVGCSAHKVKSDSDKTTGSAAEKWFGKGIRDKRQLAEVCAKGWTDGLNKIYEAVGQVGGGIVPVSLKRRIVRGDTGDNYDIHRAMSGGLDRAWDSRKRQKRVAGGAQLTIAVSIGQSAATHADAAFWRGAAAVRLADLMTEAGYQVQVVGYASTIDTFDTGTPHGLTLVEVKAASEPLDLTALATSVALAGFYRHFVLWQYHAQNNVVVSDHGRSERAAELVGVDINITVESIYDRASCERFIRNTVAMYGMERAA